MKKKLIVFAVMFLIFSNSCKREDVAKGDDSSTLVKLKSADDTSYIQGLIDNGGSTVTLPTGTWNIDAEIGIIPKSNMTLNMTNVTLKAIANSLDGYNIINISNKTNVTINGGTVQGERATHTGTTGEWGMGIGIYGSSYVTISNLTAKDCWGDGFYITGSSSDVTLTNVISDNNRRQGLSIISADGVIVQNSIFKNTNGTAPMAGIDVEPNEGQTVNDVQIIYNEVMSNHLDGIAAFDQYSDSYITNLIIYGNNVHNNGTQGQGTFALELIKVSGVGVYGNNIHDNIRGGILITEGSTDNTIRNNIINNNGNATNNYDYGTGISSGSTGNTVSGNIVINHADGNIVDADGGNSISGNIENPGLPIAKFLLDETSGSSVADNSGNGHTGTASGAYTWTAGHLAYSISLNSANQNTGYITIPDASALDFGNNNFSVGYWVFKRAQTSNWSNIWGVDKWNTGSSPGSNEWCLNLTSTGSNDIPNFCIESGSTTYQAIATSSIYNGWHHVVGVRDGSTLRIYVDGSQQGTASCGSVTVNNAGRSLYIGNSYMNGSLPNAIFDNVSIYNYALSASQVLELYNYSGSN